MSATLTCYGGVGAVTGANFLFEAEGKKILIDCGLLQGVPGADEVNERSFEYDPAEIDCLFVTHAHADHIGKIPKLVKDGFKGKIFSTPETKSLSELMLLDTARITERNARAEGGEAMFGEEDARQSFTLWEAISYHEQREFEGYSVEFFDAGHILGSAMIKFTLPSGKSIVFTGDLGNSPSPILRDTERVKADYMLIESVYGDRNHEAPEERAKKLEGILKRTLERKGTLIIPVFSLERTQVILFELQKIFDRGAFPKVPVFLDSPLAIHVTEIYERSIKHFNGDAQKEFKHDGEIFSFRNLHETLEVRDSKEIEHVNGPKIILAGSGMSTAGRILHHEERYLPDPNAAILFVGYQAPGTLGREIVDGAKQVFINDHEVPVHAHVEEISGYSGHKDSDHLVEFVSFAKDSIKKVYVAMGETKSSLYLAGRLESELGIDAVVPERLTKYSLDM